MYMAVDWLLLLIKNNVLVVIGKLMYFHDAYEVFFFSPGGSNASNQN